MTIACGTWTVARGVVEVLPSQILWGSDLDGGLFVQKYVGALGISYGVSHHSGWAVARTAYRYLDARALQRRLLALQVDWTQSAEALCQLYRDRDPAYVLAGCLVRQWEDQYGLWQGEEDEEEET
jgi:hypothetical protein